MKGIRERRGKQDGNEGSLLGMKAEKGEGTKGPNKQKVWCLFSVFTLSHFIYIFIAVGHQQQIETDLSATLSVI